MVKYLVVNEPDSGSPSILADEIQDLNAAIQIAKTNGIEHEYDKNTVLKVVGKVEADDTVPLKIKRYDKI